MQGKQDRDEHVGRARNKIFSSCSTVSMCVCVCVCVSTAYSLILCVFKEALTEGGEGD